MSCSWSFTTKPVPGWTFEHCFHSKFCNTGMGFPCQELRIFLWHFPFEIYWRSVIHHVTRNQKNGSQYIMYANIRLKRRNFCFILWKTGITSGTNALRVRCVKIRGYWILNLSCLEVVSGWQCQRKMCHGKKSQTDCITFGQRTWLWKNFCLQAGKKDTMF